MAIDGVLIIPLKKHADSRGWLVELFRTDTLPEGFEVAMSYFSMTHPGVARGPHEHHDQTDGFIFFDGTYELHLWENRPGAADNYEVHRIGEDNPVFVTVPPGVVHGYKNVSERDAFVINVPNRLYAGKNRSEEVDEIRHEADENSKFKI
ncbi:dTDP-4-dehydrorhamnose 3,5-epimerase family protein [soil metagenome]